MSTLKNSVVADVTFTLRCSFDNLPPTNTYFLEWDTDMTHGKSFPAKPQPNGQLTFAAFAFNGTIITQRSRASLESWFLDSPLKLTLTSPKPAGPVEALRTGATGKSAREKGGKEKEIAIGVAYCNLAAPLSLFSSDCLTAASEQGLSLAPLLRSPTLQGVPQHKGQDITMNVELACDGIQCKFGNDYMKVGPNGTWEPSTENECYSLGLPDDFDLPRLNKRITISDDLASVMRGDTGGNADGEFGDSGLNSSSDQVGEREGREQSRAPTLARPSSRHASPQPAARPSSRDYNRQQGANLQMLAGSPTVNIQQAHGSVGGMQGMQMQQPQFGVPRPASGSNFANSPPSGNSAAFEDDLQKLKKLRELSELQALEDEEEKARNAPKPVCVTDTIFEQRTTPLQAYQQQQRQKRNEPKVVAPTIDRYIECLMKEQLTGGGTVGGAATSSTDKRAPTKPANPMLIRPAFQKQKFSQMKQQFVSNNNDLIEQITEITKAQKELQARILEEEKKKQKEDAEKKLAMLIEEEEIEKKLSKVVLGSDEGNIELVAPKTIALTELNEYEGRMLMKKNSYLLTYNPTAKFDINSTVEHEYNPIPDHIISVLTEMALNTKEDRIDEFESLFQSGLNSMRDNMASNEVPISYQNEMEQTFITALRDSIIRSYDRKTSRKEIRRNRSLKNLGFSEAPTPSASLSHFSDLDREIDAMVAAELDDDDDDGSSSSAAGGVHARRTSAGFAMAQRGQHGSLGRRMRSTASNLAQPGMRSFGSNPRLDEATGLPIQQSTARVPPLPRPGSGLTINLAQVINPHQQQQQPQHSAPQQALSPRSQLQLQQQPLSPRSRDQAMQSNSALQQNRAVPIPNPNVQLQAQPNSPRGSGKPNSPRNNSPRELNSPRGQPQPQQGQNVQSPSTTPQPAQQSTPPTLVRPSSNLSPRGVPSSGPLSPRSMVGSQQQAQDLQHQPPHSPRGMEQSRAPMGMNLKLPLQGGVSPQSQLQPSSQPLSPRSQQQGSQLNALISNMSKKSPSQGQSNLVSSSEQPSGNAQSPPMGIRHQTPQRNLSAQVQSIQSGSPSVGTGNAGNLSYNYNASSSGGSSYNSPSYNNSYSESASMASRDDDSASHGEASSTGSSYSAREPSAQRTMNPVIISSRGDRQGSLAPRRVRPNSNNPTPDLKQRTFLNLVKQCYDLFIELEKSISELAVSIYTQIMNQMSMSIVAKVKSLRDVREKIEALKTEEGEISKQLNLDLNALLLFIKLFDDDILIFLKLLVQFEKSETQEILAAIESKLNTILSLIMRYKQTYEPKIQLLS